jgi:hypothetical protein
MLAAHVDHFVITESSVSHAGQPAPQGLEEVLDLVPELRHRITAKRLEIPAASALPVMEIDYLNTHEIYSNRLINQGNIDNVRARVRERLQKDSLLLELHQFPKDTVFLHSDCDEIIDPRHLKYLCEVCTSNPSVVVKIPLVYLQGRADLRVHDRRTNAAIPWAGGMFLAMKSHFDRATPTQIRSNNQNPWPVQYITENNRIVEDLGWHFSWMGTSQHRQQKARNFTHYQDDLSFLRTGSYSDHRHQEFLQSLELVSGSMPPSGDVTQVLRPYDHDRLPREIWQMPQIRDFLLPESSFVPLV